MTWPWGVRNRTGSYIGRQTFRLATLIFTWVCFSRAAQCVVGDGLAVVEIPRSLPLGVQMTSTVQQSQISAVVMMSPSQQRVSDFRLLAAIASV
jgi:hypothetical protein